MGELNEMETIASQGGRIDPGGYRWPPTYATSSKTIISVWQFFTIFRVLNFRGHFEALNDIFWLRNGPSNNLRLSHGPIFVLYSSARPFQRSLERPKQRSYAKVMPPRSWNTNLPLRGPQKLLMFDLLGSCLGFLSLYHLC